MARRQLDYTRELACLRFRPNVAATRGQIYSPYASSLDPDIAHDRADDDRDAGRQHRLFHRASDLDLIVIHNGRMRAAAVGQRIFLGAEIAKDVVGDTVRELITIRAVREEAAEGRNIELTA